MVNRLYKIMIKLTIRSFLLLVLTLGLVGCGFFGKHENLYKESHSIAPMRVPSGLSSAGIESYYPVPAAKSRKPLGDISLLPPGVSRT